MEFKTPSFSHVGGGHVPLCNSRAETRFVCGSTRQWLNEYSLTVEPYPLVVALLCENLICSFILE